MITHDTAILQRDDAIGKFEDPIVMCDHNRGRSPLSPHGFQHFDHFAA